jgi:hypothetical protein
VFKITKFTYTNDSVSIDRFSLNSLATLPPWRSSRTVTNHVDHSIAAENQSYIYFEDEPGRRSATELLTRDEARPTKQASIPRLTRAAGIGERLSWRPLG